MRDNRSLLRRLGCLGLRIWRKMSRQTFLYVVIPIPLWFMGDAGWPIALLISALMWGIALPFGIWGDLRRDLQDDYSLE